MFGSGFYGSQYYGQVELLEFLDLFFGDSGSGAESQGISVLVSGHEIGIATEGQSIIVTFTVTESGHGVENDFVPVIESDHGSAVEHQSITIFIGTPQVFTAIIDLGEPYLVMAVFSSEEPLTALMGDPYILHASFSGDPLLSGATP